MKPAVSVIVPFFQSAATIEACIESLRAQTGVEGPLELVFIDNGARDGSRGIVEGYDDVTLLEESEPGAYAARNTGIRRAGAPLLLFTDADCAVDADWARTAQERMRDPALGALIGHCRYPKHASKALAFLGAYENAKAAYVLERCPLSQRFAYANNMAVRASVFDEVGLFREWKRAGDTELVHRMATLRPDLGFEFEARMRITHNEFVEGRKRARRLSLYTETNAQIETFRELGAGQRLSILLRTLAGLGRSPRA